MRVLGKLEFTYECSTAKLRHAGGVDSGLEVSRSVLDERRGELLVGTPPG